MQRAPAGFLLLVALGTLSLQAAQLPLVENDEARLIQVLQSNASLQEKDAACVSLKRIGTDRSIPALSSLLRDEQLSHSARYALESMLSPKAGAVLVQALESTSGQIRLGIINSLGVRRESQAVSPLSRLLPAKGAPAADYQTVAAAAAALGEVASPPAVRALESLAKSSEASQPVHATAVNGLLRSATRLQDAGNESGAFTIFRRLYKQETADAVRQAAYRGMILTGGKEAWPLLSRGLTGEAGPAKVAALQTARLVAAHDKNYSDLTTVRLANLLPQLPAEIQLPLVESLAQRADPAAVPRLLGLVSSAAPEVCLAAIAAVGTIGDASAVPVLARVAASGSPPERDAAREALVLLHRGDVKAAMLSQLASAAPEVQAQLALVLGRRGDSAAMPSLLGLAAQAPDPTRKACLEAIDSLASPRDLSAIVQLVLKAGSEQARLDAAETLSAVIQRFQARELSFDLQPLLRGLSGSVASERIALLPVCSSLSSPEIRAALRAALADSDPAVRKAAITALCDSHDPALLPDLQKIASDAPEENFRALAVAACVRLTTQEEGVHLSNAERLAPFKALLAKPLPAAEKRMLLAGLAEISDSAAFDLAEPMLNDPEVQAEAARAVIRLAPAMPNAAAEPSAALTRIGDSASDPNIRQAAQAAFNQIRIRADYLTSWQVAGPFRERGKNFSDLFDIVFAPEKPGSETSSTVPWKALPPGADAARPGVMNLLKALGGEQCVAYARTRVYSESPRPARLELGSDDGIKVWLNRKLVHANNVSRPIQPGSDKVNVDLQAGWNELLLKVTQNNQGWAFSARLLQPDGSHLDGLRCDPGP